jgi:serpin B
MTNTQDAELREKDPHGYYTPEAARHSNYTTLALTNALADLNDDETENVVVSPFNVLQCLMMVAYGAQGSTKAEMAEKLFNCDSEELAEKLADFGKLVQDILVTNKDSVTLNTAYGAWVNNAMVELKDDFAQRLNDLGAEVNNAPFSDETKDKVNEWCADKTNNLIDSIIDDLDPLDVAVLVSALYFKGDWAFKFDKANTEDKMFRADNGQSAQIPTMHKVVDAYNERGDENESEFGYQETEGYQALSLEYGEKDLENGRQPTMRLVLVRPKDDNQSAAAFLKTQFNEKAKAIPAWLSPYGYREAVGQIAIPKMDMESDYDLKDAVSAIGAGEMFKEGQADFSEMMKGDDGLFVSQLNHKTVFKTDEEGSEAAAVTAAVMTLECAIMPPAPIEFNLNRSFVMALQDIKSGAVLFSGVINKPQKDMQFMKRCPS